MESILIVDDEPHVRSLLSTILEKAGYICTTAQDVIQAKNFLVQSAFGLLITDLDLPGESGFDLITFCNEQYPRMAVVIVSLLDDPQAVKDILDLGIYGFLVKPFTKNLVLITVDNAIRRHRLEQQAKHINLVLEREVEARTRSLDEQVFFYQALIDAIPVPVFYKNIEGIYLGCNQAYARNFNLQPSQLIGKSLFAIHARELASQLMERDNELFRSGGVQIYERTIRLPDGRKQIGITHKATFTDSKGVLAGLVGVVLDITAQKNTEESLRVSEEKLRLIMDSLQLGVMMINAGLNILQVNRQMHLWFPEFFTRIEDTSLLDFIAAQEISHILPQISEQNLCSLSNPLELTVQLDSTLKNRFFRLVFSPVCSAENGPSSAAVVLFEDVTEKLVMEQDLNQAQKLEAIGQLAAGIAHEINTPVQYIGDNLRFLNEGFHDLERICRQYEQLLHTVKAGSPTDQQVSALEKTLNDADIDYILDELPKTVEQSLEGVNRVGAIVRAMREFSHPGSEEKVPVDINHALENTLTVSRNEWKYVADSQTRFAPDLPLLKCLPGEINQVFLNLIINAAHAISEANDGGRKGKGTITLATSISDDGWMEIRIADNGSGIPEAVRNRIFDPFFTTKKIGKGTGQGLAIARSVVVDKHQGRLRFETEVGRGTTFIIQLPLT